VAKLEKVSGTKAIVEHLRTVLYPMLARSIVVVEDVGRDIAAALEALEEPNEDKEALSYESAEFIDGYVDGVFMLVQQFGASAEEWAKQGHPEMLESFQALLEGGAAVKAYIKTLVVDEGEEEDSDGGQ